MLGNADNYKDNIQTVSIIFMGENGSGKSVLRETIAPISNKISPLQFSYYSTDTFKVLAYELIGNSSLLDLVLKKDDLNDAIVVISIDLSKPQDAMKSFIGLVKLLKSHISKIDPERDNKTSLVSWLNYLQYLDSFGIPRESRLNTNMDFNLIDEASCLNFGLKMVLVGTRSETLTDDTQLLDFMHQSLRAICFKCIYGLLIEIVGMPLLYVSTEIPETMTRFKDYLYHYSFSNLYSLDRNGSQDEWGYPTKPEYLEREKTFIPAGWDTVDMIKSFSEQTKYDVSEYFTRKDLLEWVVEYYSEKFPIIVEPRLEFNPVNEQEFLLHFSKLNAEQESESEPIRPVKINNLNSSVGSAQNEVLSNFFKSLLAKKG